MLALRCENYKVFNLIWLIFMSYINTDKELILSAFKAENHVILVEIRIFISVTRFLTMKIELKMIKFNCQWFYFLLMKNSLFYPISPHPDHHHHHAHSG
jgi:hypothetical protein